MSYLNNGTRLASLTIGGVDYSSSMVEFVVSDTSANKNGLVSTSGVLTLQSYGEAPQMEDYDRDNFKRGTVVLVDVTLPDGSVVRHPRGYLYVISTAYEPEADQLSVELGCRLVLAAISEDVSAILPLAPIPLDPAQQTYQNIAASFAAAGQYLYQDNQGALVSAEFFEGDSTSSIAPGEWVSILGTTAIQAGPLAGTGAIPDKINLSYQVPSDALVSDQRGRIEETITESYYYTQYPSIIYTRKQTTPDNEPPIPTPPAPRPPSPPRNSGCGNIPPPPETDPGTPIPPNGGEVISCSDQYETKQQTTFVPAYRNELQRTVYNGPSGQVSYTFTEVRGPAIEANNQYYSDKYAYCRYTYASQCSPNGGCPMDGLTNQVLQYEEQYNYYGSANELVRTVKDTWLTELSGAQPSDWRSGVSGGVVSSFRTISSTPMYRAQRVETVYKYGANQTTQETTTYSSITSRQSGISGGNIDALSGIKTFQRRLSTTISANPVAPDIVNTVTTSTTEREQEVLLFSNRYLTPPSESGPYEIDEQIPVPILFENETQINQVVNIYAQYLTFFVKGDALGIQLTETLRDDIISNWRPGMPFRYYDPKKGKIVAMRMDATSWGLSGSEALVTTNGIFLGISNGSISIPRNLVGDSRPDMGGGTLPPAPIDGPPSVGGENYVDQGSFAWVVNVNVGVSVVKNFWGNDGVVPQLPSGEDLQFNAHPYVTVWCDGIIVAAGDLLDAGSNGSIPVEYSGNLVVQGATVVDANLFG